MNRAEGWGLFCKTDYYIKDVLLLRFKLGWLDFVLKDSAESYFNQSLSIYESLYGSSHDKVLEIKDELSRLMIRTDRVQVRLWFSGLSV